MNSPVGYNMSYIVIRCSLNLIRQSLFPNKIQLLNSFQLPTFIYSSRSTIIPEKLKHNREASVKRLTKKKKKEKKKGKLRATNMAETQKRISEEIGVPSREITLNFVLTKHAPLFIL